jgi:signal transduction histidine kinase
MSAHVDSSARWVERLLTGSFERLGWRGIVNRSMLAAAAFGLTWATLAMTIGGLIARLSGGDLVRLAAVNGIAALVALGVAFWLAFRDVRTFEEWERSGSPSSEAAAMLRLVVNSGVRWTTCGLGVYLLVAIPAIFAVITATADPSIANSYGFLTVFVIGGQTAGVLVTWLVMVFGAELGARPQIARIHAQFPHLSGSSGGGMSLRTRALFPVPAVTLSTGIIVGALAGLFDDPFKQLTAAILISLAFTVFIVGILRLAVTEAALRPVDDLIDGVERISRGDLGSRVPITGADELAVLGRAVNEMSDRLASHDAEMRASRARIVAASDESRRRVERDLHDGAQQYLVLLELKLGLLAKAATDDPEAVPGLVSEMRTDLGQALAELRDLAHGIYPAVLESDGLPGALVAAAERSSIPVTIDADGVGRYAQELEAAIYFCCLEALQNAAKHAGDGAKVSVRLSQVDGQVRFEVGDDGSGYDTTAMGPSAGLQNMADRIGALGGELHIESTPGAGTTVRGAVPVEATR